MSGNFRCLLVDDEPKSALVFEKTVRSLGHACDMATNQKKAVALLGKRNGPGYSYVLLDLKLKLDDNDPEPDSCVGLGLLRRIRENHSKESLPILVMTAYDKDPDTVVEVMNSGANDFVVKGCAPKELLKRITAMVQRPGTAPRKSPTDGAKPSSKTRYVLEISEDRPNVMFYKGRRISLSKLEYKFMLYLAGHANRELHTDAILSAVWGDKEPESQQIGCIRDGINKKIKSVDRKFNGKDFIKNLRGSGWMLALPAGQVNRNGDIPA